MGWKMTQRCGYIAIMGRPNAGKSSLLNTLVGQKIAGVSAKPQTTRNRILGIALEGESQLLFLDTPGIHRQHRGLALNSMMNREAWGVLSDADCVVYLVDVTAVGHAQDLEFLRNILKDYRGPLFVCLNKIDKVKKEDVFNARQRLGAQLDQLLSSLPPETIGDRLDKIWTISTKRRDSLQKLLERVGTVLPEGSWLYPADELTDRSQKFVTAEMIREQVFRCLGAEVPYHVAVQVQELELGPELVRIEADVIVDRQQHKGIVLGQGGQKIKEIGMKARQTLEQHFGKKVFVGLEVVVDANWANDPYAVANYSELHIDSPENHA